MGRVVRDGIPMLYHDETRTREFWETQYATWELPESRWMARFCRKDRVSLDIGAWNGVHTLYLAHLSKHVYALEPDPCAFQDLRANVEANPVDNVTLLDVALAERNGTALLGAQGRPLGRSGASILPTMTAGSDVMVRTVTFPALLADLRLEPTDMAFIKMNIEGAEALVIPMMAGFLRGFKGAINVSLHTHLIGPEGRDAVCGLLNTCLEMTEVGLWAHESLVVNT